MSEHTLLPWKWDGDDLWHFGKSYNDKIDPHRYTGISIDKRLRDSPILKKNMALVDSAVNSHASLVAALKNAQSLHPCEMYAAALRDAGETI